MRTVLRSLIAGSILVAGSIGLAAAAEPLLGTWHLNLAKSQFNPGAAPKSFTRVFTAREDAIDLVLSVVRPDGSPVSGHAFFRLDGKDYPITGLGNADTMAVTRTDAQHYETTMKKNGTVVGSVSSTVSADGKVLTQIAKSPGTGDTPTSVMVFEKQ
jgi:hypothetical protein